MLCIRSPWLWEDWIFMMTPDGYKWRNILATLHGFTDQVIQERKQEFISAKQHTASSGQDDVGLKKRLAFLDLLIEASDGGKVLTDADIREEVDTFMFEGDCWSLNIVNHDPVYRSWHHSHQHVLHSLPAGQSSTDPEKVSRRTGVNIWRWSASSNFSGSL